MQTRASSTLFPLLSFELFDSTTHEELDYGFDLFRQVASRGMYVTVTDTTGIRSMPDALKRKYMAKKQAEKDKLYGAQSLGAVVIITSSVVRGAMTAVSWTKPMQMRNAVVATRLEGVRLCAEWLESAREPIPDGVHAYIRALERNPSAPFP